MRDRQDTVPAPPVPSKNPTADMRKELEAQVREASVAIMKSGMVYFGLVIHDGFAERYTCDVSKEDGDAWLEAAQRTLRAGGTWIPTVCARCGKPRATPSLCKHCTGGAR